MTMTAGDAETSRVSDLTWDEVALRLASGTMAILPVGAGAKQHGWHLPMGTDALQAEWLAARLAASTPALIWPTLGYGHYPAFVAYAGSCSLTAATFEAIVRELVDGLLGYGTRGVLVVDTGVSTIAPINRAIAASADPRRVLHLAVYGGPRLAAARERLVTQVHGGHADEVETSILLALAPAVVRPDRAVASPGIPPGPGPIQHADPAAANHSASGSIGDPSGATAEKGRTFLDAMVEDMAAAVAAWQASR